LYNFGIKYIKIGVSQVTDKELEINRELLKK